MKQWLINVLFVLCKKSPIIHVYEKAHIYMIYAVWLFSRSLMFRMTEIEYISR